LGQNITASFTLKDGESSSETFPPPDFLPPGNCYKTRLSHYDGSSSAMTPEKCNEICGSKQYNFFGVRYTKECWCSKAKPSVWTLKPMAECNMPCSGDSSKTCGGLYHNNLWSVCKDADCQFSYKAKKNFPPSGNCYKINLPHYDGSSSAMTPEKCNGMCGAKKYNFFGVRFTKECWCSRGEPSFIDRKPMEECNMPCSGDSSRTCGGTYHNNIWSVCKDADCQFSYV